MYRNVECNVFFIVITIIIITLIVFMVCYDIITKVISLRENTQTEEMWKLKKCEQPKNVLTLRDFSFIYSPFSLQKKLCQKK